MSNKPTIILAAAEAAASGDGFTITENTSFQAFLTGSSGALAAVVDIEVSNDNEHFIQAASISLSVANWTAAADDDTDGFFASELQSWAYVRARLVSISGTGAAATAIMGK